MADETPFEQYIRGRARKLREGDVVPRTAAEWEQRRRALRDHILNASGPVPDKPCDLEPRNLGTLQRDGYRIEKLVFQSRPDVWVTASAYVPTLKDGEKVPAVLAVHGHWPWARRDPVVQARCLGLVKLGFFVLAIDAFGAGERYTRPARGTYHGALYGSTLWPTGHTLLGMQVYDNRRAVDYLLTRKEVNGKLGVTGASGGGNQSMYAGALDERFAAVVPVCSVGNYQAYLRAACCVCEVLLGALTFTEEGDVLGLVAPRALMVINAARDAVQFSPAEAEKSVARANDVFKLLDAPEKVRHVVFASGHDYSRPMREAMYGWMALHLKGHGKGDPIPEPEHTVEKPEDLACYPDPNDRPKGFLTPPLFAGKVGRELVAKADRLVPDHPEMWEATANHVRATLKSLLGEPTFPRGLAVTFDEARGADGGLVAGVSLHVEERLAINCRLNFLRPPFGGVKTFRKVVVLSPEADREVPATIIRAPGKGAAVLRPELRATGMQQPKSGAIAGAPDHNSAEHGIWVGEPLLAQWAHDATASLVALDKWGEALPVVLVAFGVLAPVALAALPFAPERLKAVILIDPLVTYVTDAPYASGTPMGILAPGILNVGDIPHLAGLVAPRRLIIAGGVSPQGKKLSQKELDEAFRFTTAVYKAVRMPDRLTITTDPKWDSLDL